MESNLQLPVRMLNEYVYCPRLAYMEWVQGEWRDNTDTEAGRHAHRRVDKKSGNLPEAGEQDEDAPVHARSLTLSHDSLGLIGKLDLVEGEWVQLSVFQCRLSQRRHQRLRAELENEIRREEDHVLIFRLGRADSDIADCVSLGRSFAPLVREPIVI
ncbi:hypothetical protein Q4485_00075 [Granulosicoccaceae sp. 1_MG-2023]|nr:hypothetical protein [Granulosicoccaceae sp. 1_MG-2023]